MNKLRIFHINSERTFRGGEVQTLLLARELQARGHSNLVIAQKDSPLAEKAQEANIPTLELRMRGEWDIIGAWKLRKAVQEYSPDIVHAHTPHACSLALFAKIAPVGLVCSRRVIFPLPKNPLTRYKYRNVDAVLAVSQAVRNQLVTDGLPAEKIFIAQSGTDFSMLDRANSQAQARASLGISEPAFVIGNVSYFDQHKGQSHLIQAFEKFAERCADRSLYLLLVGDGPLLHFCRSLAERSNLADRVLFTGHRLDIENLYAAMDIFFLSSIPPAVEGWSGVLREAMGAGLPVIAVRQPAIEEQVRPAETGLLVSTELEDWIVAMETLFQDSEKRKRLGKKGMVEARKYTVQALADQTEICYRAVFSRS